MNCVRSITMASLALAVCTTARAQTNDAPWVELEAISVMAGVGGGSGDGQLHLPNLGTNCDYPFKVGGFGASVKLNVSKLWASGPVKGLTKLEDFPGTYTASEGEVTLLAGRASGALKNNAVSLDLEAKTAGVGIGISGQGLTIDMPIALENAPRVYVLEFGFGKTWVNADSRKTLNDLVDAWKCRFVSIEVAGHADAKEDDLNLSELRALAVRNYLVSAGVVPSRVTTQVRSDLQVLTGKGVRLRANRVAVVTIH
jgi:outer membrane protein OmpA-like peptidoglycan-associated protein